MGWVIKISAIEMVLLGESLILQNLGSRKCVVHFKGE